MTFGCTGQDRPKRAHEITWASAALFAVRAAPASAGRRHSRALERISSATPPRACPMQLWRSPVACTTFAEPGVPGGIATRLLIFDRVYGQDCAKMGGA